MEVYDGNTVVKPLQNSCKSSKSLPNNFLIFPPRYQLLNYFFLSPESHNLEGIGIGTFEKVSAKISWNLCCMNCGYGVALQKNLREAKKDGVLQEHPGAVDKDLFFHHHQF